jgi:hypothetical protein
MLGPVEASIISNFTDPKNTRSKFIDEPYLGQAVPQGIQRHTDVQGPYGAGVQKKIRPPQHNTGEQ